MNPSFDYHHGFTMAASSLNFIPDFSLVKKVQAGNVLTESHLITMGNAKYLIKEIIAKTILLAFSNASTEFSMSEIINYLSYIPYIEGLPVYDMLLNRLCSLSLWSKIEFVESMANLLMSNPRLRFSIRKWSSKKCLDEGLNSVSELFLFIQSVGFGQLAFIPCSVLSKFVSYLENYKVEDLSVLLYFFSTFDAHNWKIIQDLIPDDLVRLLSQIFLSPLIANEKALREISLSAYLNASDHLKGIEICDSQISSLISSAQNQPEANPSLLLIDAMRDINDLLQKECQAPSTHFDDDLVFKLVQTFNPIIPYSWSFDRLFSIHCPGILRGIIKSEFAHLFLLVISGLNEESIKFVHSVYIGSMLLISANEYVLTTDLFEPQFLPLASLALIILISNPESFEMIPIRLRSLFGIHLVELINSEFLEPILLVLELLALRNDLTLEEINQIFQKIDRAMKATSNVSLSGALAGSINGLIYYLQTSCLPSSVVKLLRYATIISEECSSDAPFSELVMYSKNSNFLRTDYSEDCIDFVLRITSKMVDSTFIRTFKPHLIISNSYERLDTSKDPILSADAGFKHDELQSCCNFWKSVGPCPLEYSVCMMMLIILIQTYENGLCSVESENSVKFAIQKTLEMIGIYSCQNKDSSEDVSLAACTRDFTERFWHSLKPDKRKLLAIFLKTKFSYVDSSSNLQLQSLDSTDKPLNLDTISEFSRVLKQLNTKETLNLALFVDSVIRINLSPPEGISGLISMLELRSDMDLHHHLSEFILIVIPATLPSKSTLIDHLWVTQPNSIISWAKYLFTNQGSKSHAIKIVDYGARLFDNKKSNVLDEILKLYLEMLSNVNGYNFSKEYLFFDQSPIDVIDLLGTTSLSSLQHWAFDHELKLNSNFSAVNYQQDISSLIKTMNSGTLCHLARKLTNHELNCLLSSVSSIKVRHKDVLSEINATLVDDILFVKSIRNRRNENSLMAIEDLKGILDVNSWKYFYYYGKCLSRVFDGSGDAVIKLFQRSLNSNCPSPKKIKPAKALAFFMARSKSSTDANIRSMFDQCFKLEENHPKSHYEFSIYLDSLNDENPDSNRLYSIMKAFAKTFMISDEFDRVVCSRFLSLWFSSLELGCLSAENSEKIAVLVEKVARKVPSYKFLLNISQIAAKICQQEKQPALQILHIFLLRLLKDYPHTTLWKIMNFCLSLSSNRREKYLFVSHAVKSISGLQQLWNDYVKLSQAFTEVCEVGKMKEPYLYISKTIPKLHNLQISFVSVPISSTIYKISRESDETVFFREFEDRIDVFPSLQRPKKLICACSDGVRRSFLCKPKDDIRKDMRLLELAYTANAILPKSGQIRIYTAIPLNEETGIIEWIDNTISLRSILTKSYKSLGISIAFPEFRDLQKSENFSLAFTDEILPRFPPQLYKWFYETYTTPMGWFSKRQCFIRTASCMSIFGHIVGLGDRHCENILLCEQEGAIMHGKLLEIPEKVPFRLTQNISTACGPLEWKDEFFHHSGQVLLALKDSKKILIANLEPMLTDPILDFQKSKNFRNVLSVVTNKLNGIEEGSVFKSVPGHVKFLIESAISPDNLSKMYVGWAPFL